MKSKKTVAIVDDNTDIIMLLEALLRDRYRTVSFDNGAEALKGFQHSPPDLILLDIVMPNMSGIALLEHLRSDEVLKSIPVIALTAHAMKGDERKYLDIGFDSYISKPFVDNNIIFDTIAKFLNE